MEDYISVIIPCYNTEKYIKKCMESVLNQTYKKIEIILVDDHSTDHTKEIIKEYEHQNNNVRVITNEENKGAAYSRNRAISQAKYNWISFIDSDDTIEPNFLETMIATQKKGKADLVICDIYLKYESVKGNNMICSACIGEVNSLNVMNNGHAASPCNKLIQKELLKKYPFPEGIMNEDIATILPIVFQSKKIAYNRETNYYYIQRKDSVQNSHINEKRMDLFKSLEILEKRIERNEKNKDYWEAIVYNQIIPFLFYYLSQEANKEKRKKYLKRYNELSKKYKIQNNSLLQEFYSKQGPKHRLYYKGLITFLTRGFYHTANTWISLYHWYSTKWKKSVIPKEIKITDIIEKAKQQNTLPIQKRKISVVIPNYNYKKFLLERVYSILNQTVKIDELIILDDCSTDGSKELIDEIVEKAKPYINIRTIYNKENSGTAFKQWRKGFENSKGDYVWIAEADDYCEKDFLKNILKPIEEDDQVVISYADTAIMDAKGFLIMKTIRKEIDLQKSKHWDENFLEDGKAEIRNYAYLNCTISNVSSVLFKKQDYKNFFEEAGKLKQAGDWLFYLDVMSTGKIAYCKKVLNYYRLHGDNVTSLTRKQNHLDEIKRIHSIIEERYGLTKEQKSKIRERYQYLKDVWNLEDE